MKKAITVLLIAISFSASAQKQQPVKDTATYVLAGKVENFIFLLNALKSPGDVTPNQLNALINWIEKVQKLEATKPK